MCMGLCSASRWSLACYALHLSTSVSVVPDSLAFLAMASGLHIISAVVSFSVVFRRLGSMTMMRLSDSMNILLAMYLTQMTSCNSQSTSP
jgi:hypothetical protein